MPSIRLGRLVRRIRLPRSIGNVRLSRYARRYLRLGRHVRRWVTIAVIVVVAAGAGTTAWAMMGPSGPSYRTATVTRANVTQTLLETGTIEPVNQANVSFPVSGQVASVSVSLGSEVKAGQVIALLSTTSLASQVSADQYSVATATVRLATDQASQTSSASTTSSTSSGSSGASGTGGSSGTGSSGGSGSGSGGSGSGGSGSGSGGSTSTITKDQAAVLAAQKLLDAKLAAAKPLMTAVATLCQTTPTPTPTPTPSPTATGSPSPTPSPSATHSHHVVHSPSATPTTSAAPSPSAARNPSATPSPSVTTSARLTSMISSPAPSPTSRPTSGPPPATCQDALTQLLSAENGIATAEQSLANAESALSKALSKASGGSGSGSGGSGSGGSGSGGSGSGGSGSGSSGSGGSGSGGSGSGGSGSGGSGSGGASAGTPATAEQLAADQASLDAANAQLNVAKQNMAAATLVAPISGTVAQVNIAPGQQVTGSQGSTANFVIQGAGGEEAATTVSGTSIGQVRVGQPATVTLDGSANTISGEVVAIGMLSSSSTGSASFPVTIGLTGHVPTLYAGSDAQVTITLAKVSDAVTVPTSAIQSLGTISFVTVLNAGKLVRTRVEVGATGPVLTQITSGLTIGEQVVLADLSIPLPTNSNPFATRGLTGGGGGFIGRAGNGATGGGAAVPAGGQKGG